MGNIDNLLSGFFNSANVQFCVLRFPENWEGKNEYSKHFIWFKMV